MDPKAVFDYKLGSRNWGIGKLHGVVSIARNAMKRMQALKQKTLVEVYKKVLNFFLLDMIEVHTDLLVRTGSIQGESLEDVQEIKEELLEYLDDHALVLAEGTRAHDKMLMSAIGHSNGKPYENLYKFAKEYGALNTLEKGVHPAMIKYYHPYRNRMEKKLNQKL